MNKPKNVIDMLFEQKSVVEQYGSRRALPDAPLDIEMVSDSRVVQGTDISTYSVRVQFGNCIAAKDQSEIDIQVRHMKEHLRRFLYSDILDEVYKAVGHAYERDFVKVLAQLQEIDNICTGRS